MRKIRNVLLLLVMSMCTNTFAQEADGVFFKVEGNGLKQPSYLLGTVHLIHGDYIHKIAGFDSLLNDIKCLATELKMEYILHPETVNTTPNLALTHEDSVKASTLIPLVLAEYADTTQGDVYERYLSKEQLDSLDSAMQFLNLDAIIKMLPQAQGLQGENFYRRIDPFSMAQLGPTLLTVKQMQNAIMSGYSQNYEMMDHAIMLTVNARNENYRKSHPDTDAVFCVGLDSTYAYRAYQESKSTNVKGLLDGLTTKKMVDFIYTKFMSLYKTGQALDQAETLYREGKGNAIIKLVTAAEPESYSDKALVDGRNQYWMTQIPALMQKGETLVAVGLAHLLKTPASEGIVSMLRKQGYKVTPIHP